MQMFLKFASQSRIGFGGFFFGKVPQKISKNDRVKVYLIYLILIVRVLRKQLFRAKQGNVYPFFVWYGSIFLIYISVLKLTKLAAVPTVLMTFTHVNKYIFFKH